MIARLDLINYDKPFKSNELVSRGHDEVSKFYLKINELVDKVNELQDELAALKAPNNVRVPKVGDGVTEDA